MYSMPSNMIELWAAIESDRFANPVMRDFYKERNVVMEERRMRTDSSPTGRLVEQFLGTAFDANPYHRPTIGYASDLQAFSATDAQNFFHQYYLPSNMVIGLVGDLDPDQVMPIIERYFGQIPAKPKPTELTTVEPPQNSVREVKLNDLAQPFYVEGYHRPSYLDPDDAVYDAITDILSNGRTSRMYRSLVRDQKIAAAAAGFSGFPGTKYPHLFAFYGVPLPGHTNQEIQKAIQQEIVRLKTEDVTDEELQMFKTRTKADLIRGLASNEGLAQQLAIYQTRYGDWRELFRYLDRVDKVSKADIRRVANNVFKDDNRTIGTIETTAPAAEAAKGAN
jgi:predicted Zn-dependent peptidase